MLLIIVRNNEGKEVLLKEMIKIEGYELLSQKVYRLLKNQISKGFIEAGEKLYENKIAEELNVSRTPVREALKKLAIEGFLKVSPNKSMVVADISFNDLKQVLQVREVLEGLAARIATDVVNKEDITELENITQNMEYAVKKNDLALFCKFDDEFHALILNVCGNKYIIKTLDGLENIFYRFRVKSLSIPGRMNSSFHEHIDILNAFKESDSLNSERLTKRHIHNIVENIIENIIEKERKDIETNLNNIKNIKGERICR